MAIISYDEILPELQYVADELMKAGIEYRAYNQGRQFNALDLEGTWHTYYQTTGTVVLHASNNITNNRTKSFRNKSLENFIKGMKTKNLTKIYF